MAKSAREAVCADANRRRPPLRDPIPKQQQATPNTLMPQSRNGSLGRERFDPRAAAGDRHSHLAAGIRRAARCLVDVPLCRPATGGGSRGARRYRRAARFQEPAAPAVQSCHRAASDPAAGHSIARALPDGHCVADRRHARGMVSRARFRRRGSWERARVRLLNAVAD